MKKPKTPEQLLAMVDRQEAAKKASPVPPQNRPGKRGGRLASGRFSKGTSGNPGGRPKGLSEAIRNMTGDGAEIAEFLLSVMRGELTATRITSLGIAIEVGPSVQERTEAAKSLASFAFAKPTVEMKLDDKSTEVLEGLKELTADKLLEIVRTEQQPRKVANLDE